MFKICSNCKISLPKTNEYFSRKKSSKDLYHSICKKCDNERAKRYRVDKKEQINNLARERYLKDSSKKIESSRIYRSKNRDKINNASKIRYIKNSEKYKIRRKKYTELNYEKVRESQRRYYLNNTEKVKKQIREYQIRNMDRRRVTEEKRRSLKNNTESNYSAKSWMKTKEFFDFKCSYCGEAKKMTQEHFIPLSKGGSHTANNIIPSCQRCNSSKKNKDFFVWYSKSEFYDKAREQKILLYLGYL